MLINDWIHVIAGTFILTSLALGVWAHPYWFFFTAFVGGQPVPIRFFQILPHGIDTQEIWD